MKEHDCDHELQKQKQKRQVWRMIEHCLVSRWVLCAHSSGEGGNTYTKTIYSKVRGERATKGERATHHQGGGHVKGDDAGDLEGVRIVDTGESHGEPWVSTSLRGLLS